MKKIALSAAALLALAALIVLGLASRQPDHFHVERRIVVAAPPAKVFPYLEDPKKTLEWSPWEKKDPNIKKTFSGAAKGVGAVYEWDGNKDIGSGRLTILESVPPSKVVIKLEFFKPMPGVSTAVYALTPKDGGSEVVWSIEGPSPLTSRIMCVFMNMDKMIGGEFEKGLAELKTLVEGKK